MKETNGMKFYYLFVPIWGLKYVLAIGSENIEEQLVKEMKKHKVSDKFISDILLDRLSYDRTAGACYFDDETAKGLLWLPNLKPFDETLQHEVVHLVDYMLMFIGATLEMEARAYTHNFIYNQIKEWLKEERKLDKKKK